MSIPRSFPLSPSSPSDAADAKPGTASKPSLSEATPHSPISPPLMSVATKRYVSSYGKNQHTDEMAQRPQSPAANFVQQPQRINAPFSTQESTLKRPSPSEDEGDHRDKRQKMDTNDRIPQIDSSHTPTNHERDDQGPASQSLDSTAVAHKSQGDQADDTNMITLEKDFEEAFLLCRSTVPRSRPDPNQHLLSTYGLGGLLRSVARVDPITGEKINKLRKSYEGQIKTFQIPGKNKPVKAEKEDKDEAGPLRQLGLIPEERWDNEQGSSKIEITDNFREKLNKALQIQPGKVRNNAMWEDILGHEKPRPNMHATPAAINRTPNGPNKSQAPSAGDKRSTRGVKRSYGDESYIGYGEGFSDGEEGAEDEDDSTRRKRKKDPTGYLSR